MFSRRPDARFNRGRVILASAASPGPPPSDTPLTILGSLAQWHKATAANMVLTGSDVDQWLDTSGNSLTSSHGGTNKPVWTAADATLDNKPTVSLGALSVLNSNLTADLSVSPFFMFAVVRIDTWEISRVPFGGVGTTRPRISTEGVTPQVAARATSSSGINGNATVGVWKVWMVQWHASAASAYTRIGSVQTAAGTNGTGTRTSSTIGANIAGMTISVAEVAHHYGVPDAGQQADLIAYANTEYPSAET